eukprot:CAMPEP_0181123868 /NCGR_PEP_ID=MMETSP1071-20121207/26153_1 /TAXON_ID=35127 /ORGANISM="Thalassiosira sp., Strain NH16" /LENGTH=321 /DNA_ID=CAMNT_0023209087 /DNA_START=62 /DNA_END=1027 /DNA_ORIENTATION=+
MAITHPVSGAMAAEPSPPTTDSTTHIDPELYDKAIMHATTMAMPAPSDPRQISSSLVQRLRSGDIEALYSVARSLNGRNAGDDRVTSVQLWHALADGPAAHVPSAAALGFSYAEVDVELALRYFVQASQGKRKEDDGTGTGGGPHQAAMFNAGRLFLERNDVASSFAYIRGCANVEREYPAYAKEELTRTCAEAYDTLSTRIRGETISPPGIEDAAEMFPYASMEEFPLPDTREFTIWARGMEYLEMYAKMVREGTEVGDISGRRKGKTYLLAAQQELEQFQNGSKGGMSELQQYLLDIILGRLQYLMMAMEAADGGLDEL